MVLEEVARGLLDPVDIEIDGDRPWDPQVHDTRFYPKALSLGSLGLGEAYMDGWWDCQALDEFFFRLLRADIDDQVPLDLAKLAASVRAGLINLQKASRAYQIGEHHYDLGNDLYEAMLDPSMTYSCGYWRHAKDLAEAQDAKLALISRKLHLEPGMRVLDIGCGWGSFAELAARRFDAEVVGLTVSKEQAELARDRCRDLPVEIRLQDYRDLQGETFDRVVSIGMFEHVGPKNHRTFMETAHHVLTDGGLQLLHTIGTRTSSLTADPWIERYIFPNSKLPSAAQISTASEDLFTVEDWHNFGPDYDKTLLAWHGNVEQAWPELSDTYDQRFRRMWRYYLLSSAGAFRARRLHLWQVVLAKDGGAPGGYEPVR